MDAIDRILGSGYDYIALAVPFFFILIAAEVLAARLERRRVYRLNDSINDLSCGVLQVVVGTFTGAALLAAYVTIWRVFDARSWHPLDVTSLSAGGKWLAAVALFLGVDCAYYWFHRVSHQMNAPWAAHAVHHQSEEYNLAVALRQGTFQPFFSWVFYLPLAAIGFPPLWFVAMSAFNTLYQFWIHTRLIGKLGPLEWVLNTPSHHRVHHGRNPKYLDKNHAGTLIIWDRMFGTFQEEEEEPVYGIVRPLASWNPLWANVHEYVELWQTARQAPYWTDKLKIWFMPPGWQPRGLPEHPPTPEVRAEGVVKYDTRLPRGLAVYVSVHFALALVLAVGVMVDEQSSRLWLLGPATLSIWALANFGGIFEHRRWALGSETARLVVTAAAIAPWSILVAEQPSLAAVSGLLAAGSLAWLWAYRREFTPERRAASLVEPSIDGRLRRQATAAMPDGRRQIEPATAEV